MQARPHVIGHGSEIFANQARVARFFQHCSQIFFALAAVRFAILRIEIIPRVKMRRLAVRSREHFVPIERQKFFVPPRPPRERVDPVKAKDMVDPEKMKTLTNAADALPPPVKISATHFIPAKNWNAPILSPFLGELIVLEMRFGRGAAAPIERKFVWPREDVPAVIADAEWDVAHQR